MDLLRLGINLFVAVCLLAIGFIWGYAYREADAAEKGKFL